MNIGEYCPEQYIILHELAGVIFYIYWMLVREIWKFIHPRVSYSPRASPEGNMIRGWINFHISCTRML